MNSYETRLLKLRNAMDESQIELALVTSPTSIYYFTGFFSDPHERFMALVIDQRRDHVSLFVPSLDKEAALAASIVESVIPVSDQDNPYQLLNSHVHQSISSIGVEKKIFSLFQFERLKEQFSQSQYHDLEDIVMGLRLRKTGDEIEIVRRAVSVVEQVLEEGVKRTAVGVSELELTAELEYHMKRLGAERPAFSTIVLSGSNSALPHGRPSKRTIQNGDFVLFDLGVFVDGYCSDITRTFIVGESSEEQKRVYNTVLDANRLAIQAVQAREPLGSLDRAARDFIIAQGYGDYFTHRVGHGLGLDVHEEPSIHSLNQMFLEPGFLFTIEPGIYIPGLGGVRIEDDVYVGQDGQVEVLTAYSKQLTIL
jgi:Xaa-Pro dipeptidase